MIKETEERINSEILYYKNRIVDLYKWGIVISILLFELYVALIVWSIASKHYFLLALNIPMLFYNCYNLWYYWDRLKINKGGNIGWGE